MAWAKYIVDKHGRVELVIVTVHLVTDGGSCYYCFRGWHTIYKCQFTLTKFRNEVDIIFHPLWSIFARYMVISTSSHIHLIHPSEHSVVLIMQ